MHNYKKLLIYSTVLNIIFVVTVIGFVVYKGGLSYVSAKVTNQKTTSDPYYLNRSQQFEMLKNTSNQIVMLGDSITDQGEWQELFPGLNIVNRGIGGDTTEGVLNRLDTITSMQPKKIFILIGVNDLHNYESIDNIVFNYRKIINSIQDKSPKTQIYIQSLLPVNNANRSVKFDDKNIIPLNKRLKELSTCNNAAFIDLYSQFATFENQLDPLCSIDGIHLNGNGYVKWRLILSKYIN